MTILNRYKEIIERKIDIPKLIETDDPVEEANKLMRNLADDLERVKIELNDTIKKEKKENSLLNQTKANVEIANEKAIKAIQEGNYDEGKTFLKQKESLEKTLNTLKSNYLISQEHLKQLNEMYGLIAQQVTILSSQKNDIKIKAAIKKAQQS